MKKIATISAIGVISWQLLLGASMSVPILKTSPEEISLTASFSEFDENAEYRLGVGVSAGSLKDLRVELLDEDGKPASFALSSFAQGYTSSWFKVDSVSAQGFVLKGSELAGQSSWILKMKLSRQEADRAGKFYVFIAKNYGSDTWYLEDGSEVDKALW